jgi:uncharacterized protein YjbI with pentapeptide repeats
MKLLKDWKPILISLLLSALMVGGVIRGIVANQKLEIKDHAALSEPSVHPENNLKQERITATPSAAKPQLSVPNPGRISAIQPESSQPANNLAKSAPLPGSFRGDWGPSPVYAKNDRVNFERGAYLSLVDGNQNQLPANSRGYWRLVKQFKALHEENCFSPAPGSDMGECDFSADNGLLKDRDLRKANLFKARLNGELGAADLSEANLSGAAVLGKLVINPETRMMGANLSYLQSDGNNPVVGESANLAGVNFTKANLYGAKLSRADLSQGKFPEAVLTGSDLTSANLSGADLNKADLTYTNLTGSNFSAARLTAASFEQADLHQANFSGASLQRANLPGVQLAGANLSGTDLSGANLASAQGADSAIIDDQTNFTGAVCPDGITVDGTQATTCVGHGF